MQPGHAKWHGFVMPQRHPKMLQSQAGQERTAAKKATGIISLRHANIRVFGSARRDFSEKVEALVGNGHVREIISTTLYIFRTTFVIFAYFFIILPPLFCRGLGSLLTTGDNSSTVDVGPAGGDLSGAGWNASDTGPYLYQPAHSQYMIGWPAEGMEYGR
jgi:hypothetical protein